MSFYEPQAWQAPVRQASWEQPPPPSRSGASSTSQRDETSAFATQFEEVDRAIDNLVKSGKFYPGGSRRESMPPAYSSGPNRSFEHGPGSVSGSGSGPASGPGPRYHGGRHSVSDGDPARGRSAANGQNFYASQRFQGRPSDVDPMMQAKRRMAAQRERELRNYHQEQQYNRSLLAEMSSTKSDRSMSPSTLSEEGRRELIARQHRALYGGETSGYASQSNYGDDAVTREQSGNISTSASGGVRGASPRGVDPFGGSTQSNQAEGTTQGDRKATSPTTQQGKAPTPPTGDESNHSRQISKSTTAPMTGGMGPIGSRPNAQQAPGQSLNKRTTSPLPASLGYGFGGADQNNERSGSSNSNPNNSKDSSNTTSMGTWGTGSGVWGSNKIGATSVWG